MMGRWTVSVGDPILLQTVLKDVETFPKEENVSFDPVTQCVSFFLGMKGAYSLFVTGPDPDKQGGQCG